MTQNERLSLVEKEKEVLEALRGSKEVANGSDLESWVEAYKRGGRNALRGALLVRARYKLSTVTRHALRRTGSFLHHALSLRWMIPRSTLVAIVLVAVSWVWLLWVAILQLPRLLGPLTEAYWWAHTTLGLFLLFVVFGYGLGRFYLFFEAMVLNLRLGPQATNLKTLARLDFLLLVDEKKDELGVTQPFAVMAAILYRMTTFRSVLGRLIRLGDEKEQRQYDELQKDLKDGWRSSWERTVLAHYLDGFNRLSFLGKREGLPGRILIASLTYLLGDLRHGNRLAREVQDELLRLEPRNTALEWANAYALINSQLFLGHFERAACQLGELWSAYLKAGPRGDELRETAARNALLDPIASIPRHIILASAFAGKPLSSAETRPSPMAEDADGETWASYWWERGRELGEKAALGANQERISTDFTRGYMALYRLVTEDATDERIEELIGDQLIPQGSPDASLYVKSGVKGLYLFKKGRFRKARNELRKADSFGRHSGNRFLDGVFLPVYAAAEARASGRVTPLAVGLELRARRTASLGESPFYDALVDAARSVLATVDAKPRKAARLLRRAQLSGAGLVSIFLAKPDVGRAC